jgi:hypothetical protein
MKNIITLIVFSLAFNLGYGQSIFSNVIEGFRPNTDNPYTIAQIADPNITVSGIGRGGGIGGSNADNRYSAKPWDVVALDATKYFYLSMTPNAGYEIDFVSFVYTGQSSGTGPTNIAIRSSLDGYTSNIGVPTINGSTIDLSAITYQNISSSITFRIYVWGASDVSGTFSIDDFTFNAAAVTLGTCSTSTTWNGTVWDNGDPNFTTEAIIDGPYNTGNGGAEISFNACSLTVNTGSRLTVDNNTYVEIETDVTVNGELFVETQGAFIQRGDGLDAGAFTGVATVNKTTALKQAWYYYTYWSSPVAGETIDSAFPDAPVDRRFWYDANSYLDITPTDGIDDNGDDWKLANGVDTVIPGVGYAVTSSPIGPAFPRTDIIPFNGVLNTGDIPSTIFFDGANSEHWNFIGNPYSSAIDFVAFQGANSSVIGGTAYFWSQSSEPNAANPGNENSNFSQNDYATFTVGTGGAAGASGVIPTQYIPSGQGFFAVGIANGTVTFNNSMRVADTSSNDLFFRVAETSAKKSGNENRLWIDLTSDNGIFNQILVGYVNGASNINDGLSYDAPRNLSGNFASVLYSTIQGSNDKYVIQGKAANSLTEDEIINVGFKTTINVPTIYTLSIAQLEGDFLNGNPIYLKDNLLNTLHNLKDSDYNFTSTVGEFNERFEIVFNQDALSLGDQTITNNDLSIIELRNGDLQFKLSGNLAMLSIQIIDLQGRILYDLKTEGNSKAYNLSNISLAPYLAKVTLSNGATITKKAIKRL